MIYTPLHFEMIILRALSVEPMSLTEVGQWVERKSGGLITIGRGNLHRPKELLLKRRLIDFYDRAAVDGSLKPHYRYVLTKEGKEAHDRARGAILAIMNA